MATVLLRPTRPDDLPHVIGEPLPWRIWALTGEVEGRVIGVGGLTFAPDGVVRVFAALTDEARRYKVSLHRAGLRVMTMAREAGYRHLVTMADSEVEAAERWLHRLGFTPHDSNGTTVYIWQTRSP